MTFFISGVRRHVLLLACLPLLAVAQPQADGTPIIDFSSCAKPVYPPEALKKEQVGAVKLEFTVAADGAVTQSRVVSSTFHPLLDNAARDALQRCRFKPARKNGKAVASTAPVMYVWTLESDDGQEEVLPLAGAPAPLQAFLKQAREADALVDRYQRCQAFPDFPGNAWPAGLGKQYCDITAGPHIGGDQIRQLLARGRVAELDALFQRDLARHFAPGDYSEVIHNDFQFFRNAGEDANQVSLTWIEKAPESAFANAARGYYLYHAASAARGGKWTKDTPSENMGRMHDLAAMSRKFFEKALRREPRLMPAFAGLIDVARIASEDALGESAYARGTVVDPGCRELSRRQMHALEPRWGGSHADMLALSRRLDQFVGTRPLVALNQVLPALDIADRFDDADDNAKVVELLEPVAKVAPYVDLFIKLGTRKVYADGDGWDALVRLLVAYRYADDDAEAALARGRMLLDLGRDPAWAMASLRRAVELEPANLGYHFMLGRGQLDAHEPELAETSFSTALASPEWGEDAAFNLVLTAMYKGDYERAADRAAAFAADHTDQPRALYTKGWLNMRLDRQDDAKAAFASYLKLAADQPEEGSTQRIDIATRYLAGDRDPKLTGVVKDAPKP